MDQSLVDLPVDLRSAFPARASEFGVHPVRDLYGAEYADAYESFYLAPWQKKHRLNIDLIARLMRDTAVSPVRWLDLCCGQAWHFSRFSGSVEKTGVDLSAHQLARAARRNPDACFRQADIRDVAFARQAFDLVTCFWGAYCYLDDDADIAHMVERAANWIAPGGALYFEILLPQDLSSFNRSAFARDHQFRVAPLTPDFHRWSYRDGAGTHIMTSPSLDVFIDTVSPLFARIEATHDDGFMTHLVARKRHDQGAKDAASQTGDGHVHQPKEDSP